MLAAERALERQFAADPVRESEQGAGWSPALLLFHVYRGRERLRDGLRQLLDGRTVTTPPADIDGLNERELGEGKGLALTDAAARSDELSGELIELWQALRYFHPRNHIAEHYIERGDRARGARLFEETTLGLRQANVPGHTLGPALCNLAGARVAAGRREQALALLQEGVPMRADLAGLVAKDPIFVALNDDPRFRALIASR